MGNKLPLLELLDLKKGAVVSVIGSGGKTTFCRELSLELYEKFLTDDNVSILFSTTTKIRNFSDGNYRKIIFKPDSNLNIEKFNNLKGLYLLGMRNAEKLYSLPLDVLEEVRKNFTYTILEADGSKRKLLKAWNMTEPVHLKSTTITVGIIPIKAKGLKINDINIHRLEIFAEKFNHKKKLTVDTDLLVEIIKNKDGLFKGAMGTKILFINQVETEEEIKIAKKIAEHIKTSNIVQKIIIGSLHKKNFQIY